MHRLFDILKSNAVYLSLLILILVAAFLRFYKLGEWSFWGDEIFTLSPKPDGFIPSLSYRLIHTTTAYLGVNEWNARLVPALVGVVTIPVLFFFIARCFGKSVALISCALLAVSTWHIYWSQNVRFYALLLLFYSLAQISFFLALEEDRPWLLILSLAFLGLAAQERMLALILLPVIVSYILALFVLPFEKPPGLNLRNMLIYFAPGLIVALFIAGPFLGNLGGWITGFGRINNNPIWLLSGFIYYVGFPIACMAGFGAIYLLLKKDRAGLFFGLAAVVPLFAIMAISIVQYAANRYFFISLTSWIILASLATFELIRQQKGRPWVLAVGVLILLLGSSLSEDYLYYRYQNGNRDNWRAALQFIKEKGQVDDIVFLGDPDVGNYYLSRRTYHLGDFDANAVSQSSRRSWFIVDMNTPELFPETLTWIEEHGHQVADFDVAVRGRTYTMRVYLYNPAWTQNQIIPDRSVCLSCFS
jgi:mannosyltransferase